MQIETHKRYDKQWSKLTKAQQQKALRTIKLFIKDSTQPQLRLHQLSGKWYPHYSISAGGDLRIHYLVLGDHHIILTAIGSHAQLYG